MQAEAEAESVRVSSGRCCGAGVSRPHLLPSHHTVLCPPQMRGEAEAFAIGARARAEAEQMAKKAEAFQLYQEAAQLDMLLEKLPQVGYHRNRCHRTRLGTTS